MSGERDEAGTDVPFVVIMVICAIAALFVAAASGFDLGRMSIARDDCRARGFVEGKVDGHGLISCGTERLPGWPPEREGK